jgi:hypothetical protein
MGNCARTVRACRKAGEFPRAPAASSARRQAPSTAGHGCFLLFRFHVKENDETIT